MKCLTRLLALCVLAWAPAFCDQINIGDIFYLDQGNGTTQFYLDNFSGITDGCSATGGFPACDDLSISGTLTYSYFNGTTDVDRSATLTSPIGTDDANGGSAYSPLNFLVPTDSTNILSASFSGSLSPVNFNICTDMTVTNCTSPDEVLFNSDGKVLSSGDVVAGGGFALLVTTTASTTAIPEPSGMGFLLLGSLALMSRFKRQGRSERFSGGK